MATKVLEMLLLHLASMRPIKYHYPSKQPSATQTLTEVSATNATTATAAITATTATVAKVTIVEDDADAVSCFTQYLRLSGATIEPVIAF